MGTIRYRYRVVVPGDYGYTQDCRTKQEALETAQCECLRKNRLHPSATVERWRSDTREWQVVMRYWYDGGLQYIEY